MEFVSFTSPSPKEPEENHEISIPIDIGIYIWVQQVSGKMLNTSNLHSSYILLPDTLHTRFIN